MDQDLLEWAIDRQKELLKEADRLHLVAQVRRPGKLRSQVGDYLIRLGMRIKAETDLTGLVARTPYPSIDEWAVK